jgi:hypothetical protein
MPKFPAVLPDQSRVAIGFGHCEPFEYLRINSPKGACLHAEVAFRYAGVAISLLSKPYETASVLPPPRESLAMTLGQGILRRRTFSMQVSDAMRFNEGVLLDLLQVER